MAGRQNKLQLREGNVVSGRSKLERAKYVHTENNLRKTLLNISESFRRTTKKLSGETKSLRDEMDKFRQSVEKVRQEKQRRITGECSSYRRPHRAERLLLDEANVKQQPFSDNQKFVYKSKSRKARGKYLTPLRLHENGVSDMDREIIAGNKYDEWKCTEFLPEIKTNHSESKSENEAPKPRKMINAVVTVDSVYNHADSDVFDSNERMQCDTTTNCAGIQTNNNATKTVVTIPQRSPTNGYNHSNNPESNERRKSSSVQHSGLQGNMGPSNVMPAISVCDSLDIGVVGNSNFTRLKTIQRKPHILPPLERIPEILEPTTCFFPSLKNRTFVDSARIVLNESVGEKDSTTVNRKQNNIIS